MTRPRTNTAHQQVFVMKRAAPFVFSSSMAILAACGASSGSTDEPTPQEEAGVHGGGEAESGSSSASDSGSDVGSDSGSDAGSDSGSDAGSDSGSDAGSDSGSDADGGSEAGSDSGNDAGSDGGSEAGSDSGNDAGSDSGVGCTPGARQCSGATAVQTCGSSGQWDNPVACPASSPECLNGACLAAPLDGGPAMPPSCQAGGSGVFDCGGDGGVESCCTSLEVTGGTYFRTYTNSGSGADRRGRSGDRERLPARQVPGDGRPVPSVREMPVDDGGLTGRPRARASTRT